MPPHSALLRFYATGCQQAFAQFQQEYFGLVCHWVKGRLPGNTAARHEVVEELVQGVFVKVWKTGQNGSQWDPNRSKLTTWLRTIAVRQVASWVRKRGGKELLGTDWRQIGDEPTDFESAQEDQKTAQPDFRLEQAELKAKLRRAIDQLPAESRRILELHLFEKLPYSVIAKQEGIAIASVCRRYHAAIKQLKALGGDWDMGA